MIQGFLGERQHKTGYIQHKNQLNYMNGLLINYAKEGDTILDTHLGSGSIAIACHNLGYDLTGYEIDKEYFEAAKKRIEQHKQQTRLF